MQKHMRAAVEHHGHGALHAAGNCREPPQLYRNESQHSCCLSTCIPRYDHHACSLRPSTSPQQTPSPVLAAAF